MKKILFWFRKEFGVLSIQECRELDLEFCHNLYGDMINNFNCRSLWRDYKGKSYRCEELIL